MSTIFPFNDEVATYVSVQFTRLDYRGIVKVTRKQLYVDRGGHEDEFEVESAFEKVAKHSKKEVSMDVSLVHLVYNDDIVPGEEGVCLQLTEEETLEKGGRGRGGRERWGEGGGGGRVEGRRGGEGGEVEKEGTEGE